MKPVNYLILFSALLLSSCKKEAIDPIIFRPTDHIISSLGSKMRFVIQVPNKGFYHFSSDDSSLNCEGNICKEYLVPLSEMNKIARNLSDTTLFHWQYMTAVSPYPEDDCELLIYGGINLSKGGYNDYMCSIGKGKSAANILRELSESVTTYDVKSAFDEVINCLNK